MANDAVDPVVRLADELFNDPRTRPLMEQGIATLHPERAAMAVPGYAMKQELDKDREEFRKEREAFKAEREKEKTDATNAAQLAAWRSAVIDQGVPREDLASVEKLARERRIGDPEAVGDLYKKHKQLAEPTSGRFGVQIPGAKMGEFFKGFDENPDQWSRTQAAKDIAAIKRGGLAALEPSPLG